MKGTYDIKTTILLIICKASDLLVASQIVRLYFFKELCNPWEKQGRITVSH